MQASSANVGKNEKGNLYTTWNRSHMQYHLAHTRSRAIPSTLATLCMVLAFSAYFFVVAPGPVGATDSNPYLAPATACSPIQLLAQQQSLGSGVNTSLAIQTALSTPTYAIALATQGQSSFLSFNSVFDLFSLNMTSCSAVVTSVDVVFSANNMTSAENLVAAEIPSSYSVSDVTSQSTSVGAIQHTPYLWGGWEMPIPSSYSPYAQWTVPILSAPPGCPPLGITCPYGFTIWVGQTVIPGGLSWISQTGTDQRGVAICFVFYCTWSAASGAWYEFYPANGVATFGVNSGDSISAYSTYSGGTYGVDTVDLTSGHGYYASAQHSGAPAYAQFTSENDQVAGVNLDPPNFGSVTIQGEMKISSSSYLYDLLVLNPYPYTSATHISVGNIVYQGVCGHDSCFKLTHT